MIFSIITAKLIAEILHIFHFGATTLPGRIALKMKYNILNRLSHGVKIICVTGTNGKTTTCALLEYALKAQGFSYFINKSGANMISGVATAFLMNCNIFGKCKREYAILECDENSLPEISRYLDASVVAVTNIFRDQLDRYGETDYALNSIISGIENMPDSILVLNSDCPLTFYIGEKCENKIMTFGINADFNQNSVSDTRYCPRCKSELIYKSRVFAHLGNYSCPKCAYKRAYPDICIDSVGRYDEYGSEFAVACAGENECASISLGGLYNLYNYACARAVLRALEIDEKGILGGFTGAFGRMERFQYQNGSVLLLLVKNPAGFSSCIRYASQIRGDFSMAFALNDNDADGRDVSWIWDVSFDELSERECDVITVGKRSYDMALRLKYAGISCKSIDGEDYQQLLKIIMNSKKNYVIFANYTAMMNMRKHLIKAFGGKDFWE